MDPNTPIRDISRRPNVTNSSFCRMEKTDRHARNCKRSGSITLVEEHYEIMHTLSFKEALDSIIIYMKHKGGNLT